MKCKAFVVKLGEYGVLVLVSGADRGSGPNMHGGSGFTKFGDVPSQLRVHTVDLILQLLLPCPACPPCLGVHLSREKGKREELQNQITNGKQSPLELEPLPQLHPPAGGEGCSNALTWSRMLH